MGEIIKHGLLRSESYYRWLNENHSGIARKDPESLREMIFRSCKIKAEIVETDPFEKGPRALLNLGHTLGHAVEKESGFLLPHVLYGLNTHSGFTGRKKQSVLASGCRVNGVSLRKIVPERPFDFITEVHNHLVAAFPRNRNSVVLEIHVCKVKANHLGHADAGPEQKSNNGQIAYFGLLIIRERLPFQGLSPVLHVIKQRGDFICIQTDNRFLMYRSSSIAEIPNS